MPLYQGSLSATSPHHSLLATLHSSTLTIRSSTTQHIISQHGLDPSLSARCKMLRFYQPPPASFKRKTARSSTGPARILLATDSTVHIYDALRPSNKSTLTNAAHPTPKLAYTALLSPEHVLVVPDFSPKATIYNLRTGNGYEIRDPKPPRGGAGYTTRRETGHVALLVKNNGKDGVAVIRLGEGRGRRGTTRSNKSNGRDSAESIDALEEGGLEASWNLETLDVQGIKWSPDGRWLVVWDTPGQGSGVWVYTAEGQLFRRWDDSEAAEYVPLGVRICEWDESGRWLWVGMGDGRVVGLGTRTFHSQVTLRFPATIEAHPTSSILSEQISATAPYTRAYASTPTPAIPPGPPAPAKSSSTAIQAPPPSGITHLVSSSSSLASVSATTPTTIHIHTIRPDSAQPIITRAILIHHAPIKNLVWHPTHPGLLLTHCLNSANLSSDGHTVRHWAHIWNANATNAEGEATIIHSNVPAPEKSTAPGVQPGVIGTGASWSWASDGDDQTVMLSTPQGCAILSSPSVSANDRNHPSEHDTRPNLNDGSHGEADPLDDSALYTKSGFLREPEHESESESPFKSSIPITGDGPEDAFDEGCSMDLSPVRLEEVGFRGHGGGPGEDDTFAYKKRGMA